MTMKSVFNLSRQQKCYIVSSETEFPFKFQTMLICHSFYKEICRWVDIHNVSIIRCSTHWLTSMWKVKNFRSKINSVQKSKLSILTTSFHPVCTTLYGRLSILFNYNLFFESTIQESQPLMYWLRFLIRVSSICRFTLTNWLYNKIFLFWFYTRRFNKISWLY